MIARVKVFPNSALKIDNKKINYYSFLIDGTNKDCNNSLKKIFPKIDMNKINAIIDDVPCISLVRKRFYKKILKYRYEMILLQACKNIISPR